MTSLARHFCRVAIWIALVAAGTLGPAAVRATEEIVIPSETCRGLWIVPLSFGSDPERVLRFMLDTGASYTSVDPDAIERLTGRRVPTGKWVRLRGGQAGSMKINKIKVKSHEMDRTARAVGTSLDGILGFPTFESLLLTLDYPAEEIRVSRGSLPEIDNKVIFRDVGKVRPFLALEIGGTLIPVLVDSGFTGGVTLRESDPLEWAIEPRAVSSSVRHHGSRLNRTGRLDVNVTYGPLIMEQPIVDIIEEGTRLSGEDVLRRFVWTFDQRSRRIRMVASSEDPIRFDPERGTGLALRPTDLGFEVYEVFPDSAAAEARLRKGDVIVAIDGTPVYERGCLSTDDDPDRDGVVISVVRGKKRFDVAIVSRVLVP